MDDKNQFNVTGFFNFYIVKYIWVMFMTLENQFRMLVGGYYGVLEMEEHELRIFILKDIEDYIREFIELNPILNFNYREEAELVNKSLTLKRKLQDTLRVLPLVEAPLEFILLVQKTLRKIQE